MNKQPEIHSVIIYTIFKQINDIGINACNFATEAPNRLIKDKNLQLSGCQIALIDRNIMVVYKVCLKTAKNQNKTILEPS